MASTAQFRTFGPFFQAGNLITAPLVFHYAAGTSTLLNAYTDRAKSVTAAQPLVGDANGVASAFFDGLYKIVVQTSAGGALFTWDNVDVRPIDIALFQLVSVKDFGAVGDGITNDTAAFTAAGSSAASVEAHVPAGTYLLNASPTPSGVVTWVLHAGATTTGAGVLPGKIIKFGAADGLISILNKKTTAPATGEALGLKVGVGSGAETGWTLNPSNTSFVTLMSYISSSAVRNTIFSDFSLVEIPSGFPAQAWTFLGSMNNGDANAGDPRTATQNLGVEVESGGSFAPSAAFATNGTSAANRWKHGIWFDYVGGQAGSTLIKANSNISVDYGLDLSLATIAFQGVRIGTATAVVAPIGIKQFANAGIGIFLQRFTDTAPTGLLLQVTNTANTIVLASIDALGVITGTSAVIGGAPAGQGPLGVKQLANAGVGIFLQRFTDTAPTGNLLQVTNAANNAVLAAIDAAGTIYSNIYTVVSGNLNLSPSTGDIQWNKALVALGGGAAPTLGTIGGTGPATAAQNTWMRVLDSAGVAFWVPAWK